MTDVILWIAIISTLLFGLRLVLMLMGLDGAGAADAVDTVDAFDAADLADAGDIADAADFKIFTLMTGVVWLMVGSWIVLLFDDFGWDPWLSLGAGYGVGLGVGVLVGYGLFSMRKLQHDGTLRNFEASGLRGTCYISIPEAGTGKGQVQLTVEGRLRTFDAVSDGPAIDSFKPVIVMARVDQHTLRVCETE